MKTVYDDNFSLQPSDKEFNYQKELTKKLDAFDEEFSQELINEIVLWKVNRYAKLDNQTLELINSIDENSKIVDEKLTREVLQLLLETKGIQLAMASTILKYRNPNIYQIIDQRVYRIINPEKIFKTNYTKSITNISNQIDLYINYLSDLEKVCKKLDIPFNLADRILYEADKRINKNEKLLNYGSSNKI